MRATRALTNTCCRCNLFIFIMHYKSHQMCSYVLPCIHTLKNSVNNSVQKQNHCKLSPITYAFYEDFKIFFAKIKNSWILYIYILRIEVGVVIYMHPTSGRRCSPVHHVDMNCRLREVWFSGTRFLLNTE